MTGLPVFKTCVRACARVCGSTQSYPRVTSWTHRRHQTTELLPPQSHPPALFLPVHLPPRPCPRETTARSPPLSLPPFEDAVYKGRQRAASEPACGHTAPPGCHVQPPFPFYGQVIVQALLGQRWFRQPIPQDVWCRVFGCCDWSCGEHCVRCLQEHMLPCLWDACPGMHLLGVWQLHVYFAEAEAPCSRAALPLPVPASPAREPVSLILPGAVPSRSVFSSSQSCGVVAHCGLSLRSGAAGGVEHHFLCLFGVRSFILF